MKKNFFLLILILFLGSCSNNQNINQENNSEINSNRTYFVTLNSSNIKEYLYWDYTFTETKISTSPSGSYFYNANFNVKIHSLSSNFSFIDGPRIKFGTEVGASQWCNLKLDGTGACSFSLGPYNSIGRPVSLNSVYIVEGNVKITN
jgi:hypothetical protein